MFRILAILFLVVPILEIWVLIQAASAIGGLNAIALMILISAVAAFLVRREGLSLIMRFQERLGSGELPTKELVDGVLVAMAGALMLTPGFVTDAVGLLCLFPPTRAIIRTFLIARYGSRVSVTGPGATMGDAAGGFGPGFRPGGSSGPAGSGGPGGFGPHGPGGFGPGGFGSGRGGDDVIDVGEAGYERGDGRDVERDEGDGPPELGG